MAPGAPTSYRQLTAVAAIPEACPPGEGIPRLFICLTGNESRNGASCCAQECGGRKNHYLVLLLSGAFE